MQRRSGVEMQTEEKWCRDADRGEVVWRCRQKSSGVEIQAEEKWCRDAGRGEGM
jgi:hypothetical protein